MGSEGMWWDIAYRDEGAGIEQESNGKTEWMDMKWKPGGHFGGSVGLKRITKHFCCLYS